MSFTVVGLVGSLRKDSFNRKLYNHIVDNAPADFEITEITGWGDWPILNQDDLANMPTEIAAAGEQLRDADAVIIVSPEYNFSVPGGLKNAIDWLSRVPPAPGPFAGKPVLIAGASGGPVGTARMQYQLRQILVFLDAYPVNKPELMLGNAPQAFDEDGNLTNEVTADLVQQALVRLAEHGRKLAS